MIAAGIEETHKPVADPQAAAANVEDLRLGTQPLVQQGDQVSPASLLKRLEGNTQEPVPGQSFLPRGLVLWT